MFNKKEMNAWEKKPTDNQTWDNAKEDFQDMYRGKRKYMEEHKARASGFKSTNSSNQRSKAFIQTNHSAVSFISAGRSNGPPGSINAANVTSNDHQTFIEYTNSCKGALEDAKEHATAITTDDDRILEMMMEQQKKVIEMIMNAGIGKPTTVDNSAGTVRGNPGKSLLPRKCGICGKDGVQHLEKD